MSAAVLLGGGELLIAEAAVSAILLVSLDPSTSDALHAQPHPRGPDRRRRRAGGHPRCCSRPIRRCTSARAAQAVFAGLGWRAGAARGGARRAATRSGRRGAGRGPRARRARRRVRRGARASGARPRGSRRGGGRADRARALRARASPRSTSRSATRACSRATRCGCCASDEPVPETLPDAVRELGSPSGRWPSAYEQPERADDVRAHALRAGSLAGRGGRPRCRRRSARPRSTCGAPPTSLATRPSALEAPTEELLATVP